MTDKWEDPTETWRAAFAELRETRTAFEDTAADLQRTMKALAASQQDLTAMQAERDALAVLNAELTAEVYECRATAEKYLSQRDDALHDLANAAFYLTQERRSREWWQQAAKAAGVAGGCYRCSRPILPGQDVEPQPGTTKVSYLHRLCPTSEETP